MVSRDTYDIDEARLQEAADWYARLQDDAAPEADWLAFTKWLEKDELNSLAYNHLEDLMMEVADTVPEAQEKPQETTINVIDARARFMRPRAWAAAITAAAAMLLFAFNMQGFLGSDPETLLYETGAETRTVVLADGSSVHMNAASRLSVSFSGEARETELEAGEALFDVAKEHGRPFYVTAGERRVRVVGTVFNVKRSDGILTVTVAEGIVEVAPTTGANKEPERLVAGRQLVHLAGGLEDTVSDVNAEAVVAWKDGYLEYEEAPLSKVVSDLNLHFETKIEVDERIADLPFSGILHIRSETAVVELLAEAFPIEVVRRNGKIILMPKTKD